MTCAVTGGEGGSWHTNLMTAVIMVWSASCSGGAKAVPRREAETTGALAVRSEILVPDPSGFAATLPGYDVLAGTEQGVLRIDARSGESLSLGDVGAVSSAAALSADALVLASDTGLWASDGHALVASPLAEAAGLAPDAAPVLCATPRLLGGDATDLWIAAATGLSLVRDGTLYDLEPADLGGAGASFAFGAPVGDRAVPWVGGADGLYALVEGDGGLEARAADLDVAAESLTVDARGELWVLEDGELARRAADGKWQRLYLPEPIVALAGDGGSEAIWVQTDTGLYRGRDGVFSPIEGPPGGALAAVDAAGRALLVGPEGVVRASVGRTILLFGLEDGALLDHEAILEVVPSEAEEVSVVEATLDGEPAEVAADPPRVLLDPLVLADGPHELAVTVHWGETEETESLFFAVGAFDAPTWSRDVAPLFLDHCARCHGYGGAGHRMDTPALWRSQFDTILEMVGSGRMPLPPNPSLSPEDLQVLRAWRAGGFPE